MTPGTYGRVESVAGGVSASVREFLKAAHTMILPEMRLRDKRTLRHIWLRRGLEHRRRAQDIAIIYGYRFK